MRFNVNAVSVALLAAVCLSLPFVPNAQDFNSRTRLAIQPVCGDGSHVFDINNSGTATSAVLRYRITARAMESMPALKTWNLVLFPLAPGQAFRLTVPRAAWGLKISVEVFSDAAATQVVAATKKATPYPNFCW